MRALEVVAALARMPAQLKALSENMARHLNAVTKALEHLGSLQLQHGPHTVTVLLLGEGLEDDRRVPLFAAVNVLIPTGEGLVTKGLMQLQRPCARGAWLVAVGGRISNATVGQLCCDSAHGGASPVLRLGEPIMIGVALQFTVHGP